MSTSNGSRQGQTSQFSWQWPSNSPSSNSSTTAVDAGAGSCAGGSRRLWFNGRHARLWLDQRGRFSDGFYWRSGFEDLYRCRLRIGALTMSRIAAVASEPARNLGGGSARGVEQAVVGSGAQKQLADGRFVASSGKHKGGAAHRRCAFTRPRPNRAPFDAGTRQIGPRLHGCL